MAFYRSTSDISLSNWTTIQQRATTGNQLSDDAPSDSVGGAGLVFENGVWKYPQQATCGRFVFDAERSKKIRYVMADLGASGATWSLHVAGIDNTANGPLNTSEEPYDSAHAALYQEADIAVADGSGRYLALDFDTASVEAPNIVLPGQRVYFVTTGADEPLVRITFQPLFDSKG